MLLYYLATYSHLMAFVSRGFPSQKWSEFSAFLHFLVLLNELLLTVLFLL